MSSLGRREPVGLPGEQRYMSLRFGSVVIADMMSGTSMAKSRDDINGALKISTSLTCAETAYMPYVGGQVRIWSMPGRQKHRRRASMASSLPTPTKRCSGVSVLVVWLWVLRKLQSSCLRSF